jgi:topoisomerase-4 subunit A
VRALKGHELDAATLAFKAGDGLYGLFRCRSVDPLLVFGSPMHGSARVYTVAVSLLPGGRGDGQPITSLIDLEPGTRPAHYFAGTADTTLLLANSGGFGLLARVSDMLGRNRGGKAFLSVEDGDEVLMPASVASGHSQVACLAQSGRLLVFALDELKLQTKGGKGLTLMEVDTKDPLVSVASFAEQLRLLGSGRGGKAKEESLRAASVAEHAGKRARKGRKVAGFVKLLRVA